jgi:hypothetical protein
MRKRIVVVVALALAAAIAGGCKKKKAGDACSGDEALCLDKTSILECQGGKLAQMTCKGPQGCTEKHKGSTTSGRTVTHNYAVDCDFTGNPAGDACLEDEAMCSPDKTSMVSCKDKKIVVTKCLGPKA